MSGSIVTLDEMGALGPSPWVLDPLAAGLPQQNYQEIMRYAERYYRASEAHRPWATKAKKSVDFYEGKQWSHADLQKLEREGRPALTINKLRPLVNLVMGYHLNNNTDYKALPGNDGNGTSDIARVISDVFKQICQMNEMQYIDGEVFLDGLLTGRGFFDTRMDFSQNMFGRTKIGAADPFSTYLDPDGLEYDLNSGSFTISTYWISMDEVEHFYGPSAAQRVQPLTNGMVFSSMPSVIYEGDEEITPWRRFGGDVENQQAWAVYSSQFYDWVDTYRKTVRMLDMQHYVRCWRWFWVDLQSGDQKPIPDDWGPDKVQKVLAWAQRNGEQLIVQRKKARRLRWTHMVGDVIVFDQWSPYDTFTLTPYFPYFRRGQTQGMVEHLLDPQSEINVRRSARQNIVGRSSNTGWMVEKGTLTPQEKQNLDENGGRPGIIVEWDPGQNNARSKPTPIQPSQSPVSVEQLEKEAENDIKEIAGINNSALGQIDQATISGRAIQARQQQTVIGLEGFIDNYHRSKKLHGKKLLEIVQQHYTEQRVIRVIGPSASPVETVINKLCAEGIVNNVTVGDYTVTISEESLSDSFLAGQFNELIQLKQMGLPIPDDFIIDASSVGRKEELRMAVQQARQAQAQQAAAGVPPQGGPPGAAHGHPGTGPGGSKTGPDGGSLPSGPEPGAPPMPGGPAHP